MTFNLFAVKPKGDKSKPNIFNIPIGKQETVKEVEEKVTAPEPVIEKAEEPVEEEAQVTEVTKEKEEVQAVETPP